MVPDWLKTNKKRLKEGSFEREIDRSGKEVPVLEDFFNESGDWEPNEVVEESRKASKRIFDL